MFTMLNVKISYNILMFLIVFIQIKKKLRILKNIRFFRIPQKSILEFNVAQVLYNIELT